jgi:hypothetical protein
MIRARRSAHSTTLKKIREVQCEFHTVSLVTWGKVRLSPLGTLATNWPIVPAPDDRWWWMWSSRWNENWQGKPKYSEKTCPSSTLFTTNPTWPDRGSNPGRRSGKPATNRLSCGTAQVSCKQTAGYGSTWQMRINFKWFNNLWYKGYYHLRYDAV